MARPTHDDDRGAELVAPEPDVEPDQAATMTAIALAESGGATRGSGEDSSGLWQINAATQGRAGDGADPGSGLDGLDDVRAPQVDHGRPGAAGAFGAPPPEGDDVETRSPTAGSTPLAIPEADDEVLVGFASGDDGSSPPDGFTVDALAEAAVDHGDEPVDLDGPTWSTEPEVDLDD